MDQAIGAKMAASPDIPKGTYKLRSGDDVEFSGMSGGKGGGGLFGKDSTSRLKIKIDGDNMTMTGSDGTGNLVRLK